MVCTAAIQMMMETRKHLLFTLGKKAPIKRPYLHNQDRWAFVKINQTRDMQRTESMFFDQTLGFDQRTVLHVKPISCKKQVGTTLWMLLSMIKELQDVSFSFETSVPTWLAGLTSQRTNHTELKWTPFTFSELWLINPPGLHIFPDPASQTEDIA